MSGMKEKKDWTQPDSPRIFRRPESDFNSDEPLQAATVYTEDAFRDLAGHGFNGIWLRGRLRDLMRSTVLPELNDPRRERRMASLRTAIVRGRQAGVGLYLYFNDPLALPADDSFWANHPDLAGEHHREFQGPRVTALCLSTDVGARFLEDATASVLCDLPGVAGVILITASEFHTHCWSHYARFGLDDGIASATQEPLGCLRCAQREPAELVAQIAGAWRAAADAHAPGARVIAWNWSWSLWYRDPQREVLDALPPGVDVMADWERGGQRAWRGRTITIDEYSLGYAGPSERFRGCLAAARASGRSILTKLQIGTTHEIATVPNLPLLTRLYRKLHGLQELGIDGFMGCWNFGCCPTLNTYAVRHFLDGVAVRTDGDQFAATLAQAYFGVTNSQGVVQAWERFARAFENYPFNMQMLYFSPVNDAPAHPLSLRYTAEPLGPSWMPHVFGDRIEDCLGGCTLDEVIAALDDLVREWREGLAGYEQALSELRLEADGVQRRRVRDELRCAQMISLQFESASNLFRFHRERQRVIASHGLAAPCDLPRTAELETVMRSEIDTARAALPLVEADPRLGYHGEGRTYMYDASLIRAKIARMEHELAGPVPGTAG